MKKTKLLLLFSTILFMMSAYAKAQTVQIRLVEAYNSKKGTTSPSLRDVAAMLKKNLPYNSLALLGQSSVTIPTSTPAPIGSYKISIDKVSKSLSVKVFKGNRRVFQSNVRLKQHSPVIIGGFSGNRGKILFILTK